MGVMNPQLVMRNIIPVVMAGVLGIYGLIVAVIIQGSSKFYLYLIEHISIHLCLFTLLHDINQSNILFIYSYSPNHWNWID